MTASGTHLAPGVVLANRYEIVRVLGQGGMGVVYEALHRRLGIHVAIKTISRDHVDERDLARFEREARIGAALHSKHIARVHDIDTTHAGTVFIVMELLHGRDLEHHIETGLSMRDAVRCCIDVCDALRLAHEAGIVHRDLKPANVFIGDDHEATVKVLDFGIAKELDQESFTKSKLLGTPRYMSPEQIRGLPVDGRADIYSLGVVLYRALSGRFPFEAPNPVAYMTAVISAAPTPIEDASPNVPFALADAVMRAIEREPARRFANATAFRNALAGALEQLPPPTTDSSRPTPHEAPQSGTGRAVPRGPLAVAVVLLFVAVAAIAWVTRRPPVTRETTAVATAPVVTLVPASSVTPAPSATATSAATSNASIESPRLVPPVVKPPRTPPPTTATATPTRPTATADPLPRILR